MIDSVILIWYYINNSTTLQDEAWRLTAYGFSFSTYRYRRTATSILDAASSPLTIHPPCPSSDQCMHVAFCATKPYRHIGPKGWGQVCAMWNVDSNFFFWRCAVFVGSLVKHCHRLQLEPLQFLSPLLALVLQILLGLPPHDKVIYSSSYL
jgi:hypothetical protein